MADDELFKLAAAHHNQGRLEEARKSYAQILERDPNHIEALHMLGMLAGQTGNYAPAVELISRALSLDPRRAEGFNNLGAVLRMLGRLDEATAAYEKAIELQPNYPGAYRNLGNVYGDQGRCDRAVEMFRRAVELAPDDPALHSQLIYSLHYDPAYDSATILAEHLKWAARHATPLAQQARRHSNDRYPNRRLRIGYVSPDFCNHPVGRLLRPLFASHDRKQFQIWCYSDVSSPDGTTQQLQKSVDQWVPVLGMPHDQLAERIRRDRIDILVDLAQHTGNNRMLTFARKPAPIQVAWLGYPSTTGLTTMDYRLTDPYLDPPGDGDGNYTEKSVRLPNCFWCYEPAEKSVPVNSLPARESGHVTFGCMNRFTKVTPPTLEVWRRILQRSATARLRLHSGIGSHLKSVHEFFAAGGVAPDRVEFVERKPVADYMRQYHNIDIGLDPIPHGGGTTTCDALFMGVPVITLSGCTAVGRGGASILSNLGLRSWISRTPDEYVALAVERSANLSELESLRSTLRDRLMASPLMDGPKFARDIEAAYRQMWRTWCATPVR